MSVEDVRKNYSQIGSALIEKLYSDDYLSMGGTKSTDVLAEKAGIGSDQSVLDIGCGLGGPALHLAASKGCRVTGLDLVETNVEEAQRRASVRALDQLVKFRVGDATALPFEDSEFDIVWGQDAWCHVPDKAKLIAESARVLASGGTIAFTDWLETGAMSDARRAEVHEATASTNMATMEHYCDLLETHGFEAVVQEDISDDFIHEYRAIIARLESLEVEISDTISSKVYRIIQEKNGAILQAFEERVMGGGRIVARRSERGV